MTATPKKATISAINTKQIDEAVAVGKETVTKTVEKTVAVTKAQVEKASEQAMKSFEEAANVSKESVDQLVGSFNLVSKAFEEMGRVYFEMAQTQVESQVETTKSIFAAKNINEIVDLQNKFVRNSYDKFTADSAKISEMSLKLTNDVVAPMQAQATQFVERTTKQFAA